jgi:hypothetical protein
MGARKRISAIGLVLAVSSRTSVAAAEEPPPSSPPPPILATVHFEGKAAEVTLGRGRSCTVPCETHVVPGTYSLAIDGRPSDPVVVGREPVTVVRVKSGSPRMIYGGAILLAAGLAVVAGGAVEAKTPASCSGDGFCINLNPLFGGFLEVLGAAWAAAGIGFLIGGTVHTSRAVRDLTPATQQSSWTPRVVPWATAEDGFRGGAGGITIGF